MNSGQGLKPSRQASADGHAEARATVVFYRCNAYREPRAHECATHLALAEALAALLGCDFGGEFEASRHAGRRLYFVPSDTLPSLEFAERLGIHDEHDLFGGAVPFPFVAAKTITHALADAQATAPAGWSPAFARQAHDAVLAGYSAFSAEDARRAGERLLQDGTVRVKKASGIGGIGQAVVADGAQLASQIAALDPADLQQHGVVLERNLSQVVTYSVGQVRVGPLLATYYGTQRSTPNQSGEDVYGGSDLTVVRGDFDTLLQLSLPDPVQTAVAQARRYHAAALAAFPGLYASRSNYDIAQGRDDRGQWCSGVLEQSWRIGGASGAEIAALRAFQADPGLDVVRASTTERYGVDPVVPPDACVYFSGADAHVGPLTKYSQLEPYAHP
ncbi:DUF3182 family protein [Caldimonas brevitalea]|uniref:Biotin carboxylase n=1 Tax=Caldimonas brevitalea TaxID=413882 RepID=A0A0G3BDN6_9BURK|nr:DUF3182 family protein [Caldimonas brevitalea]AKJ27529.1 biotin carboxylase [Caldimonas brevitalea]